MNPIRLLRLNDADRTIVTKLACYLVRQLQQEITVSDLQLPLDGFLDRSRHQYNSTAMVLAIQAAQSTVDMKTLVVTDRDLFIPILTFVFGEAELNGGLGIVSYHRLDPTRYGLASDSAILESRLNKESLHEIGHLFGLKHCIRQECPMHSSYDALEVDMKGDHFCRSCHEWVRTARQVRPASVHAMPVVAIAAG